MVEMELSKEKIKLINNVTENEKTIKSHDVARCPYCNSTNVFGMSRVVGYFSKIENWNKSKKAELKRRQKGNYWYKEV